MVNVAVDDSNIIVHPEEALCDLVSKNVISKIKVWEGMGLAELGQLQVRVVPWCVVFGCGQS